MDNSTKSMRAGWILVGAILMGIAMIVAELISNDANAAVKFDPVLDKLRQDDFETNGLVTTANFSNSALATFPGLDVGGDQPPSGGAAAITQDVSLGWFFYHEEPQDANDSIVVIDFSIVVSTNISSFFGVFSSSNVQQSIIRQTKLIIPIGVDAWTNMSFPIFSSHVDSLSNKIDLAFVLNETGVNAVYTGLFATVSAEKDTFTIQTTNTFMHTLSNLGGKVIHVSGGFNAGFGSTQAVGDAVSLSGVNQ